LLREYSLHGHRGKWVVRDWLDEAGDAFTSVGSHEYISPLRTGTGRLLYYLRHILGEPHFPQRYNDDQASYNASVSSLLTWTADLQSQAKLADIQKASLNAWSRSPVFLVTTVWTRLHRQTPMGPESCQAVMKSAPKRDCSDLLISVNLPKDGS